MNLESVVSHSPNQICETIDGDVVLMNIEQGKYFSLENIASAIWEATSEATTIQSLIETLIAKYEVGFEECKTDVFEFLETLQQEGLIEIMDT